MTSVVLQSFWKRRMFEKRGCNIKTVLFREKKKLLCNSKYHADMMHRSTVIWMYKGKYCEDVLHRHKVQANSMLKYWHWFWGRSFCLPHPTVDYFYRVEFLQRASKLENKFIIYHSDVTLVPPCRGLAVSLLLSWPLQCINPSYHGADACFNHICQQDKYKS